MEGEADRDDLRFRLDWPDTELPAPKSDDELTDFSFEWDEQPVELTLAQTAEPQPSDFIDVAEPALDVIEQPPITEAAPATEFAPVPDVYDAPFYDETDTLDTVRRVLNEHNDALVQLSDAVARLASNVRELVEHEPAAPAPAEDAGAVTASAMLTVSAEVSSAIEHLTERFEATRSEMQNLMDDVVAAAANPGGNGDSARITVELERLRSEVQALKRRLPVRARELDAGEIAERVAETVLAALAEQAAAAPPRRRRPPAIAEPDLDDIPLRPARVRAPAKAQPAKAQAAKARPVRRRTTDDELHEGADYPVATAKRATRQRPLRAD